jgi:hypothetical protein
MDKRLTLWILIGMIAGIIVGYTVHIGVAPDSSTFENLTKTFKLLSDIFLNLIKLLVAPLILSTIVVGIAHMGDSTALGNSVGGCSRVEQRGVAFDWRGSTHRRLTCGLARQCSGLARTSSDDVRRCARTPRNGSSLGAN